MSPPTRQPGAALVKEGSQGHTLFVILEGTAKVVRRGRTIRRLGAREVFGDVAVLDHRPRTASVVAETHDVRRSAEASLAWYGTLRA